MRPPRVPAQVKAFLRRHCRFLVLGHMEPDGDAVAAQLAMASLLRRLGKEALLCSPGPFDRPEILPFAGRFLAVAPQAPAGADAAVVLDCSSRDRLGTLAGTIEALPTLVIDHHAAGEPFGRPRWVVPEAPATAYLVQLLMEGLGVRIGPEDAELLLFGLARDTGFFRHLGPGSHPVFEAVGRLVAAGASPQRVHRMMHSGWEPAKVRLLGLCLRRAEPELGGRVLVTWQTRRDIAEATGGESGEAGGESGAAAVRGSDETYRLLQAVKGVQVVAFLQEEPGRRCSVGLRSGESVDVGAVARSLGGGGHARAAGYTRPGSIAQVRAELLAALASLLD